MGDRSFWIERRVTQPMFRRTGARVGLALMCAVALGCDEGALERHVNAGASAHGQATSGAASATNGGKAAAQAVDEAQKKAVLASLKGGWRVERSSGEQRGGHVFRERIGERIDFDGDTFSFSDTGVGASVRKTMRIVRAQAPVLLELKHRGHFGKDEKPDADAAARRSPNSKGWSRNAAVGVDGDTMTLALEFATHAPPKDLDGASPTVEVVVLSRIP